MDLTEYQKFVNSKLPPESKYLDTLIESLQNLQHKSEAKVNVAKMITASEGLGAEAGEFTEVVKKMLFQGKPLNEDNRFHMKRELGDMMFYWALACDALGYTPQEVIDENVSKLSARYKEGFTVDESENRQAGDL